MNANELADAMEIRASIRRKATSRKSVTEGANDRLADQLEKAATMLRQQQAEIEALKLQLHTTLTNRDLRTYDGKLSMNNEPVAWLLFRDGGESYPEYTNSYKQMREWETYLGDNERIEPHYTHPAKTLTPLTDDECEAIINKHDWFSKSWREMAKEIHDAILKKASEK
jgi:hypothetical protein